VLTGGTSNLDNIISLVKFRTGLDARKANLVLGLHDRHKELQISDNYTALGLLSMVENKTVSLPQIIEKTVKIGKEKKPGRFSSRLNSFVQGVLDLVDDPSEDVPMK
jgi:cell division protein FtsA